MQTGLLLETAEVAALIGQRPATLMKWRSTGHGPKYLKIGRRAVYRREAVEEWLKSRERDPLPAEKRRAQR